MEHLGIGVYDYFNICQHNLKIIDQHMSTNILFGKGRTRDKKTNWSKTRSIKVLSKHETNWVGGPPVIVEAQNISYRAIHQG